jgi:hypothetical protein
MTRAKKQKDAAEMYDDELMHYEGIEDDDVLAKITVDIGPKLRRELNRFKRELDAQAKVEQKAITEFLRKHKDDPPDPPSSLLGTDEEEGEE